MFITAIITTLLDQLTKRLAVWGFPNHGDHIVIIPRFFNLCLVENEGAAWGILPGQRWILVSVSALMLAFLVWQRKEFVKGGRFSRIMTGLLMGGIAGNLIDRVLTGKVIDFFHFHWEGVYDYPVFNIADMAICIGIFSMIFSQLFVKRTMAKG